MPWRMRISSVPHPYRKACPSVAHPSRKAYPSVAHPSRKRAAPSQLRCARVALRGRGWSPKTIASKVCLRAHADRTMPQRCGRCRDASRSRRGPILALSCLICAASLGARDHAGAAAGGHRQGEGRRGGRHAGQDGQHELAGRVAGVQPLAAHGQDHQTDAALRQVSLDGQQLGRTARQSGGLATVSTSPRA
jgi:hypothetical protein